jgi:ABC-type Fe3+ transport system permease subunit
MNSIIISVILVGVVFLFSFAFRKMMKRKVEQEVGGEKPEAYLSKTGSWIFYIFLLGLLIFFVVMYIKWKNQ